jgi:hypothetical protein
MRNHKFQAVNPFSTVSVLLHPRASRRLRRTNQEDKTYYYFALKRIDNETGFSSIGQDSRPGAL